MFSTETDWGHEGRGNEDKTKVEILSQHSDDVTLVVKTKSPGKDEWSTQFLEAALVLV